MISRTTVALFALSSAGLIGCLSHTREDADAGTDAFVEGRDGCACVDGAPNPCDAMRASGVGACRAELGYVWDGDGCRSISGCSCEGADCELLYDDASSCLVAHRMCRRACGESFGGPLPACLSGEFCLLPPGCGGDDSLGSCSPVPTSCPPPSGTSAVCGCDGTTYASECRANAAGTSANRNGSCESFGDYRIARMSATCAPTDGPAWEFTLTTSAVACAVEPPGGSLRIEVWRDLNSEPSEQTYRLSDLASDGQARVCSGSGAPCATATGIITIHFFASGEVTTFDYDVTTSDGRRFAQSNLGGTSWCRVVGSCG